MPDSAETPTRPSLGRLVLIVAGAVIILAAMQAAAPIVNLVLLGFLITLLTLPLMHRFRARGIAPRMAYLLTLLVILGAALVIFLIGLLSIGSAIRGVPTDLEKFQTQIETLSANAAQYGIPLAPLTTAASQGVKPVVEILISLAANGIGLIVFSVFAILIAAFMLAEADGFGALLKRTVGADNPTYQRVAASTQAVITYMVITAWINLLIAIGDVILLWVLGVPNPLLWGVVSFIFGFIPYIGYWVSFLPPFILAFGSGGAGVALLVLVGYALINGVVSQVVAPRMYGQGLNMSITLTLVAVLFWAWLLGPIGGILAVPLTAIIKSGLLASFPETAWLATVLSNTRGKNKESNKISSGTGD